MIGTWLSIPGGTTVIYGHMPEITNLIDAMLRFPAGEIRLPLGTMSKGSTHLHKDDQRGGRFNRKRPDGQVVEVQTPEQFVFRVTSTYDEIWYQHGRSALLLVHRASRNAIVLSVPPVDSVYSVITAFQLRPDHNSRRRQEVCIWTRPTSATASKAQGGSQ